MKKEGIYTCDRCGKEIDSEKVSYGQLDYCYNVRKNNGYLSLKRYSLTGDFSVVHLCDKCADLFHTVLGLYGFESIEDKWSKESINLKK